MEPEKVGTKLKNRNTGKCVTIVCVEKDPVVYVCDDGVRREQESILRHWVLDESESNAE